jgi:hypothetical protein
LAKEYTALAYGQKQYLSRAAPVAHTIILATREAEIRRIALKASPDKSFVRPYLEKNPTQKRAGGVAQGVGPEFKLQYWKTKNKTISFSLLIHDSNTFSYKNPKFTSFSLRFLCISGCSPYCNTLKQERHSSCAISVIYLSKLIFSFCSTGI